MSRDDGGFSHCNRVEISGVLSSLSEVRYTPAGLPIREGLLSHRSRQKEGGAVLSVAVDISFVAVGHNFSDMKSSLIGGEVLVVGFWGKHGISQKPVLHLQSLNACATIDSSNE